MMTDHGNVSPRRIDTHHHIVPDFYREWLDEQHILAGGRAIPEWSADSASNFMDSVGVETAILSVSTPGVGPALDPERGHGAQPEARAFARRLNEFCAETVRAQPERFGFFATLTLPDVEGATEEAVFALDQLGADGVVLLANTLGEYLGDPSQEELFAELDQRGAVVFVHPSTLPSEPVPGIAPYVADFLLDTTRAAASLVHNGVMSRYPNLKVILSHGGGFVPYAAGRMGASLVESRSIDDGVAELQKFYFDTALTSTRFALPSLLEFANADRVLFGSDFPYADPDRSRWFTGQLDDYDTDAHAAINRENALALFPRFA